MKTALIITVGGTPDPILKAIDEEHKAGEGLVVFLLYGRPFAGQKAPTPFDVASLAKQRCEEKGISIRLMEVADPEDIDGSLDVVRKTFREVEETNAERVVVNFTGGTKVLSAAVVHAALTEPLSGTLILDYTGGQVRDEQGRVLREAMQVKRSERTATDEILQQVLERLRRASYREAKLLAERLPDRGKAGFVKKAAEALYLWDEFDYEGSVTIMRRLYEAAQALSDDERLSELAKAVERLLEPGNRLSSLVPLLRRAQNEEVNFGERATHLPLLAADALENSGRRLQEGRPTDSVLRSYRAVEVAVQIRLLQKGISPWRPQWQDMDAETVNPFLKLQKTNQPPPALALTAGLDLLEAMGHSLSEEGRKRLLDVQQSRNYSYLEHGYQRLDMKDAQRLHEYACALCSELLGASLEGLRQSVRHF